MSYIKKLPEEPTFTQNGLKGYQFNLSEKQIGVYFIDCVKGHDKYCINRESTHIYHILEGEGTFCVDSNICDVVKNDILEIPPNTEFVFAGNMKLMLIMTPDFKPENSIDTKNNDLY